MTVSTAVSHCFEYGLQSIAPACTLTLSSFFANCTSKTEPSSLHVDSSEDEDEGEEEEEVDGNGDGIGGQSTALPRLINQRSPSQLEFNPRNIIAFSQLPAVSTVSNCTD